MYAHIKICLCICRWMRPCRATRAGTQAPPLPTSIKPFYHAIFLVFAHRHRFFRQSYNTNHTRNGRGGACVPARTSAQRRFHPQRARPHPQKWRFHPQKTRPTRKRAVSIHKQCMLTPKYVCALYRWMRPCRATRAGTQAPPLPTSIKSFCHAIFLILVRRRAHRQQSFLVLAHWQRLRRMRNGAERRGGA